jgi:hypothetical protein
MRSPLNTYLRFAQRQWGDLPPPALPPISDEMRFAYLEKMADVAAMRAGTQQTIETGIYPPLETGCFALAKMLLKDLGQERWKEAQELLASPWVWLREFDLPTAQASDSHFLAMMRFVLRRQYGGAIAVFALFCEERNLSIDLMLENEIKEATTGLPADAVRAPARS